MFVHLKGRSLEEAYIIGHEMSKEINKLNPYPLDLKFEKVYFPCILVSKKRYLGYKYDISKNVCFLKKLNFKD